MHLHFSNLRATVNTCFHLLQAIDYISLTGRFDTAFKPVIVPKTQN